MTQEEKEVLESFVRSEEFRELLLYGGLYEYMKCTNPIRRLVIESKPALGHRAATPEETAHAYANAVWDLAPVAYWPAGALIGPGEPEAEGDQ